MALDMLAEAAPSSASRDKTACAHAAGGMPPNGGSETAASGAPSAASVVAAATVGTAAIPAERSRCARDRFDVGGAVAEHDATIVHVAAVVGDARTDSSRLHHTGARGHLCGGQQEDAKGGGNRQRRGQHVG
eukprot:2122495-Prymnesium_polylepis.2